MSVKIVVFTCVLVFFLNGFIKKNSPEKDCLSGSFVSGLFSSLAAAMLLFMLARIEMGVDTAGIYSMMSPALVLLMMSISGVFVLLSFIVALSKDFRFIPIVGLLSSALVSGLMALIAFRVFFTLNGLDDLAIFGFAIAFLIAIDLLFIVLILKSYALFFGPGKKVDVQKAV